MYSIMLMNKNKLIYIFVQGIVSDSITCKNLAAKLIVCLLSV